MGALTELRQMIQGVGKKMLKVYCAEREVQWNFITPAKTHQNGCAEALVKSCKLALKKAVGEHVLTPWRWPTLSTKDQLDDHRMTPTTAPIYALAICYWVEHLLTYHKVRSKKPEILDDEWSSCRRSWNHFGDDGQETYSTCLYHEESGT